MVVQITCNAYNGVMFCMLLEFRVYESDIMTSHDTADLALHSLPPLLLPLPLSCWSARQPAALQPSPTNSLVLQHLADEVNLQQEERETSPY